MKKPYGKLFLSTLQISACTFGGGFVIVPLMRKRFVEKLGWMDQQEMLDVTAIAQSSPGAIAVNASLMVGYRVAGVPGALLAALGCVLPPLVILSVISFFYVAFRDNTWVNLAMTGMLAGVAAVVCDVVFSLARDVILLRRVLPVVMLGLAFVAARFFDANVLVILLACALVGVGETLYRRKKGEERK